MTRFLRYALIVGGALMGILLFLLATASEYSTQFDVHYEWLLDANIVVAIALLGLALTLVWRLFSRYRAREFGSRLMTRLVLLFALVGILPGTLIYTVSVQFVSRSIETWFDIKVETALKSGKSLGRTALDFLLSDLQNKARDMALELSESPEHSMTLNLLRLRERMQVSEAMVVTGRGKVIATASDKPTSLSSEIPTVEMWLKVKQNRYSAMQEEVILPPSIEGESETKTLRSRVLVPIRSSSVSFQNDVLYLQVIQPVPAELAKNAEALSLASREYSALSLGRANLKKMYIITLTLTLLLVIISAITTAFLLSGQFARPLLLLAEGTKAVTEGDFSPRPIVASQDELGSLTQSFNTMTRQLFDARMAVEKNRAELENAKAYLESVLANMSAGVMVLDTSGNLVTCNESVERILQRKIENEIGRPLAEVDGLQSFAHSIEKAFSEQHAQSAAGDSAELESHWQHQFEVPRPTTSTTGEEAPPITLLARGSHLPVSGVSGYIVVFDDISDIISAQRSIAWGEVARRLAHEIKNPLTPIQLSAERLQMKLESKLENQEALILKKATTTIVNQVDSMKRMVDDFRDYAKTPPAVLSVLNLGELIDDILHLYIGGESSDLIHVKIANNLPPILGDETQLRQVVHNLLQNAQDAIAEISDKSIPARIEVIADVVRYTGADQVAYEAVRFSVIDNGPGFSSKILSRAFEPYATSKPRGTGLGLAMVKKIVDEHGGRIDIQNRSDTHGAKVTILLLKLAKSS